MLLLKDLEISPSFLSTKKDTHLTYGGACSLFVPGTWFSFTDLLLFIPSLNQKELTAVTHNLPTLYSLLKKKKKGQLKAGE